MSGFCWYACMRTRAHTHTHMTHTHMYACKLTHRRSEGEGIVTYVQSSHEHTHTHTHSVSSLSHMCACTHTHTGIVQERVLQDTVTGARTSALPTINDRDAGSTKNKVHLRLNPKPSTVARTSALPHSQRQTLSARKKNSKIYWQTLEE